MQKVVIILFAFWLQHALAQPLFTEVGDEVGVDYVYPGNDFQMAGGGLMVIDANNDGWEDFYQCGGVFDSKLWINEKGNFVDQTTDYKLDALNGFFVQGAVSADYDNDGYQDFFIANFGVGIGRGDKKVPVLLHNVKGEYFDTISLVGVLPKGDYSAACWGDFNKDGYSDLYIANYVEAMGGIQDANGVEVGYDPSCYENKLLINQKGKGFREASSELGLNDGGCGLAVSFTDFDNDNDLDLLLLNDFGIWTGKGNKCYRNNYPESSFSDISDEVGFNQQIYGMGIGQGDYDEDADMDYYITNIGKNYLMSYNDSVFEDKANELNLDATYVYDSVVGTSWSGLFFDLEFDGDLDLYVSKGNVATLVPKAAVSDGNLLFENREGVFENVSVGSGVSDRLSHRGSILFDFDRDGDLDIISSVVKLPWGAFAGEEQKIKVYRNEADAGNFVAVKLVGEKGVNKDCFGATVIFEQNGKRMIKEVDGGSGQTSQSTKILYYGLGDAKRLEKCRINFGDGEWHCFTDLKANKLYEISSKGKICR